MKLEVPGTISENFKVQCLCTTLRFKVLRKFETICVQIGITTMTHLNQVILVLDA